MSVNLVELFRAPRVHESWIEHCPDIPRLLETVQPLIDAEVAAGHNILPAPEQVFRAFTMPIAAVRVLIIGQDPYPTPGHPVGLSFSVHPDVRPLPRSLTNIFRELSTDLGIPPAHSGDLTGWQEQGVMLLNRVLTVRAGQPGSHAGKGWEALTDAVVHALAQQPYPPVTILWGRQAQKVEQLVREAPVIASAHPSPLSASRGFFGSRPFSRTNALLQSRGQQPINWRLDTC